MSANPYRLPKIIQPVLYDLLIEPDLSRFTFEGTEVLHFHLLKASFTLVLHACDLEISSARLSGGPLRDFLTAEKIVFDAKSETVTFHFSKILHPAKKYQLSLSFKGQLNDKMHGFYRTSYMVAGQKRWGAATQFEATDARRAFVCMDEPDAKAAFQAALKVPDHLTALSNMPVIKQTRDKRTGKKTLFYQTTPVMSTYLLCFVVAELECLKGKDSNGVPIGVWTTPGKKEQGRFALEVAEHALPYFATWFGIPYSLPKLDMVALPDFASGAMENWGLVTYRETALLVDTKNSSAAAQQRVAEVIDHELAHQWFGNLVTMEWWTDLWLNEGFASYMGPKAVDHQFPEWKIWNQFIATEYLTALHDDSLKNSHPVEIPVKNPHEIREIFDHITYNKGAALNRMLEHYLGENVFRRGLRKYLKRYSFKNARTVDLWKDLEEVSGQPVRAIMATFTQQEGYPILSVEKEQQATGAVLNVEQKRFLFDGSRDTKSFRWKVPITLALQGQKKPLTALLSGQRLRLSVPVQKGQWIKFNPGQSGFYRTHYALDIQQRLVHAVERREIPPVDCTGILDDVYAQARAGILKTSVMLRLLRVCREQTDYNLWLTVSGILGGLENITPEEVREDSMHFSKNLFRIIGEHLGWEARKTDTHLDRLHRSLVIGRLGHFRDSAIIDEAKKRFAAYLRQQHLHPNLRGSVYNIVAEHGSSEDLKQLQHLYRQTDLQEEKVRLLRSLTRFRGVAEIRTVLDFSLSSEVRTQDTYVILAGFGSNISARALNWEFIKTRWKDLTQRYHSGSVGLLGHILEGSVAGFNEDKELRDVQKFFAAHPVPGTERTRKQALEVIQSNRNWKRRDAEDIARWFDSYAS